MHTMLLEIGLEEIPAGYIEPALDQMNAVLDRLLEQNRLGTKKIQTAGTPRRLTVYASGIPEKQKTASEEVTGPPAHIAFDKEGNPSAAARGFAKSQGLSLDQLKTKETPRGPYVVASVEQGGEQAIEVIPGILRDMINEVKFPKSMRWPLPPNKEEQSSGLMFARPIRWILAMLDSQVIPFSLAGLDAGRKTRGHPFLSSGNISLKSASFAGYIDKLRQAYVIADFSERREIIRKQAEEFETPQEKPVITADLLNEVTGLVEHPHVLAGTFDTEFLSVPDCVLAAAMTQYQRFFPIKGDKGQLLNKFLIVSNRTVNQQETVRKGYERVLRARLADARFFWEDDRSVPLSSRLTRLRDVVYLGGLGNNYQRSRRIEKIAVQTSRLAGLDKEKLSYVKQASSLCKADLLTGLVAEFPVLQGLIGKELAKEEGKPVEVADAIGEHYLPTSWNSPMPSSDIGNMLSLSDRIDSIVCCYAMGYVADGSQDPFAMRRNAIAVLRIIEENQIPVQLDTLLDSAIDVLKKHSAEPGGSKLQPGKKQILDFFRDRLYHEAVRRGYRHDFARAALAVGFDREAGDQRVNYNVNLFWKRLKALKDCSSRNWWSQLVETVDRTYRIQQDVTATTALDAALLVEKEEKLLASKLTEYGEHIVDLFCKGLYVEAAEKYSEAFAGPVHCFFEEVFVNVKEPALRNARKALCAEIYNLFAGYMADLFLIESPEERSEKSS